MSLKLQFLDVLYHQKYLDFYENIMYNIRNKKCGGNHIMKSIKISLAMAQKVKEFVEKYANIDSTNYYFGVKKWHIVLFQLQKKFWIKNSLF